MKVGISLRSFLYIILIGIFVQTALSSTADGDFKEQVSKILTAARNKSTELYQKIANSWQALKHYMTAQPEETQKLAQLDLKKLDPKQYRTVVDTPKQEKTKQEEIDLQFEKFFADAKELVAPEEEGVTVVISPGILQKFSEQKERYEKQGTQEQKMRLAEFTKTHEKKLSQLLGSPQKQKPLTFDLTQAKQLVSTKQPSIVQVRNFLQSVQRTIKFDSPATKKEALTFIQEYREPLQTILTQHMQTFARQQLNEKVVETAAFSSTLTSLIKVGNELGENPALQAAAPKIALALMQALSGNPVTALIEIEKYAAEGAITSAIQSKLGTRLEPFHTALAALATGSSVSSIPLYVAASEFSTIAMKAAEELHLTDKMDFNTILFGLSKEDLPPTAGGINIKDWAKDILVASTQEAVVYTLLWFIGIGFTGGTGLLPVLYYAATCGALRATVKKIAGQQGGALMNISQSWVAQNFISAAEGAVALTDVVPLICKGLAIGIIDTTIAQLGGYKEGSTKIVSAVGKATKQRIDLHVENITQAATIAKQDMDTSLKYLYGEIDEAPLPTPKQPALPAPTPKPEPTEPKKERWWQGWSWGGKGGTQEFD